MNTFTMSFDTRLAEWYELRTSIQESDLEEICIKVDKFWQQCPVTKYYLHPHDIKDWPNPWQLIHENTYCFYARALGIIYTLAILGIKGVDLVTAIDYTSTEVVLVLVEDAKYVLNYWPDSVVNTVLSDFTNVKHIDIEAVYNKIN
jgi:hypothetical protein|tara:strand:+ start:1416 stop:1853 length:438 start_codon:yes stop_codon:yes gene_type:complete